jgi:hypothetical protein
MQCLELHLLGFQLLLLVDERWTAFIQDCYSSGAIDADDLDEETFSHLSHITEMADWDACQQQQQ